jgi:S-formylglutathione hydrolase FrmB
VTWEIAGGLVLALASAAALNWGYFAQHGAASGLPPLSVRRPVRSLATLFGNRRWVVGFFTGIAGWVLYVVALTLAPLSLVQACSAGGLGILAALTGVRSRSERLAVAISIAGLVLLAVSLAGTVSGSKHANLRDAAVWMLVSAAIAAVAAGGRSAAGLGTAAGVLYAAGDVGTKAAVSGGFHVWFVPALLACHGLAFVALQLGFQRGGALATAGLATLWTNALPIVAGMAVFGEPLPAGLLGVSRVLAFGTLVAGAALLTRPGETGTVARVAAGGAAALMVFASVGSARADQPPPLPNFSQVESGPAGGTVWTGRIANPFVPSDRRDTYVYLPPGYSPDERYPVLYLLHGFWGEPSSFVDGLHFSQFADQAIQNGAVRPFLAVMPPGGLPSGSKAERAQGEWAGPSEEFVVHTVVPWTDRHLPTIRAARARTIAGVSAGAFGAVDIALRHLGLFGTAESWEGYFQPFRDGPFAHASAAVLAAHDPALLVRQNAQAIRRHGLRFFLSTGGSHGAVKRAWTFEFARELRGLRIASRLWSQPPGVPDFGRNQLPSALRYAEPVG